MDEKAYFWNDPSMPFSYAGKDVFAGEKIPAGYAEEQPESFEKFLESKQISETPDETTKSATEEVDLVKKKYVTLQSKIADLAKQEKELKEKIDALETGIDEIKKFEALKKELEMLKAEKAAWQESKKSKKGTKK